MMQSQDWKAFLVQTTTGVVGPEVNIKEGASMTIQLADSSNAKFSLDKTDLPEVDLSLWLDAWWSTILFTFQGRAIYAGPITGIPKEYWHEIQMDSSGIRTLLAKRILIEEEDYKQPKLGAQRTWFGGLSLGTIAQEVVKLTMEKPGGMLPITFPSLRETAVMDADHQRTYRAYNAGTLKIDEVLTKISEVTEGPDIMFRPKMINDSRMVWEMHHGTESNFRIAQRIIPEFDLNAEYNQSGALEITSTSMYMADRVISIGGGTNEATTMAYAQDFSKFQKGYPLLEEVITGINSESQTVVSNHAKARLKQNRKPLKEFTFFVDAYGDYPLGTYWPGDLIVIHTKGYLALPNGSHKMRLLSMQANYGSSQVRISMQLDSQWQ